MHKVLSTTPIASIRQATERGGTRGPKRRFAATSQHPKPFSSHPTFCRPLKKGACRRLGYAPTGRLPRHATNRQVGEVQRKLVSSQGHGDAPRKFTHSFGRAGWARQRLDASYLAVTGVCLESIGRVLHLT